MKTHTFFYSAFGELIVKRMKNSEARNSKFYWQNNTLDAFRHDFSIVTKEFPCPCFVRKPKF